MTDLLAGLSRQLELDLGPDGTPGNPIVVLELDQWRDADLIDVTRAARMAGDALPVTVGVLSDGLPSRLRPLTAALSLTLTDAAAPSVPDHDGLVPVSDLPGDLAPDEAAGQLRTAVERTPRAAVVCGQLLRQTSTLGTAAGLAAEAAAYSTLLAGPEFARWLAARGRRTRRRPPAEPVRIVRDGARLTIVLADPERRNAFSAVLREALVEALMLAEADDTITQVDLSGDGPAFCSGGDLAEFGAAADLTAAYLVRLSRAPGRVIDRIGSKVTVHAHGASIGAGTEMLAFARTVTATPDAFFELPEVRMGLVPGAGGSVSVTRRVGRHRAAWLMLSGMRLSAPAALRWGLIDRIAS